MTIDEQRVRALEEKTLYLERQAEELDQVVRSVFEQLDALRNEFRHLRATLEELVEESTAAADDTEQEKARGRRS